MSASTSILTYLSPTSSRFCRLISGGSVTDSDSHGTEPVYINHDQRTESHRTLELVCNNALCVESVYKMGTTLVVLSTSRNPRVELEYTSKVSTPILPLFVSLLNSLRLSGTLPSEQLPVVSHDAVTAVRRSLSASTETVDNFSSHGSCNL